MPEMNLNLRKRSVESDTAYLVLFEANGRWWKGLAWAKSHLDPICLVVQTVLMNCLGVCGSRN